MLIKPDLNYRKNAVKFMVVYRAICEYNTTKLQRFMLALLSNFAFSRLKCLYVSFHPVKHLAQETCEIEEKPKKLFVTYNDLEQSADKLVHKLDRAKSSLLSVTHQENQGMMQL